jgi:predicted NBD/HSP70 family sugar kinase
LIQSFHKENKETHMSTSLQPRALSQMNERLVLRVLQANGPCSRAEVTRLMQVTAPTVSKAVASLIDSGFLEEYDAPEAGRGRPAKKLRLASAKAKVLSLVMDADECSLVSASLDGTINSDKKITFAVPGSYDELMDQITNHIKVMNAADSDVTTLGIGISMPGMIDHREGLGIFSPNLPLTNGKTPGKDLNKRLDGDIDCVVIQESHGLCYAEQHYGDAQDLDDYVVLDTTKGVGLGVVSGGNLLQGHNGLAGEIGHFRVEKDGRLCGCGNTGCLETVIADASVSAVASEKLGRTVSIEETIELIKDKKIDFSDELQKVKEQNASSFSLIMNLYNPSVIFVHGILLKELPGFFQEVLDEAEALVLKPNWEVCSIKLTSGNKSLGAIAGIIEHLTNSVAPEIS